MRKTAAAIGITAALLLAPAAPALAQSPAQPVAAATQAAPNPATNLSQDEDKNESSGGWGLWGLLGLLGLAGLIPRKDKTPRRGGPATGGAHDSNLRP